MFSPGELGSSPQYPPQLIQIDWDSLGSHRKFMPSRVSASRILVGDGGPWETYKRKVSEINHSCHHCSCLKARTDTPHLPLLPHILESPHPHFAPLLVQVAYLVGSPDLHPLSPCPYQAKGCFPSPFSINTGQKKSKKHPCGHLGAQCILPCLLYGTASF